MKLDLSEKMKVSTSVATTNNNSASTTVKLIFLMCAALAIKEVSCTNKTTTKLQESSSSYEGATTNGPLLEAITTTTNVTEKSVVQSNKTAPLNSNKRTCACDDTEESLICASNGITYKNSCRFDCAKARVTRLRQVKQGRCSQAAGAQSYWQSSKSG